MADAQSHTLKILEHKSNDLLDEWLSGMTASSQSGRISTADLRTQAKEFLHLLRTVSTGKTGDDLQSSEWAPVRNFLSEISTSRATQGFTSSETATFVFSLKKPLFARLRKELSKDAPALAREMWDATQLLDNLGLYTVQAFQKTREEIINRQQEEMLELSTPVVKLWEGVLALPMIGTLDSART